MANTPKVMLDSSNGNNLTVLPLEQLLKGKKSTGSNSATVIESNEKQQSAVTSAPVSRTHEQTAPLRSIESRTENGRQGRIN